MAELRLQLDECGAQGGADAAMPAFECPACATPVSMGDQSCRRCKTKVHFCYETLAVLVDYPALCCGFCRAAFARSVREVDGVCPLCKHGILNLVQIRKVGPGQAS